MKRLVKVVTIILAITMFLAPATEVSAATTTITLNASKNGEKIIKKTGSYKVKLRKTSTETHSYAAIIFQAPKSGVYSVKLSGLYTNLNKDGLNTYAYLSTSAEDNEGCIKQEDPYFAGLKEYDSIALCGKDYYKFYQETGAKKDHVKSTTIRCKLKKGEKLIIRFTDLCDDDGMETTSTFAMDMQVSCK